MHTCCAPCSVFCIKQLRAEGIEPTLFWYNPNIHPYTEYKARLDALKGYAVNVGAELITEDCYGLRRFLSEIGSDYDNRCIQCYKLRLAKTAEYAAGNGYDAFTTTLFVSPYQNREMIIKEGENAAAAFGVKFLIKDFRSGFREGQNEARQLGLYMQKYCGCIFSEEERYNRKNKNL